MGSYMFIQSDLTSVTIVLPKGNHPMGGRQGNAIGVDTPVSRSVKYLGDQ